MAHLKIKGRHHVFTPRDEALVLKQAISAPEQPDLLTERGGDTHLHILKLY
jgi:hypothetical protein